MIMERVLGGIGIILFCGMNTILKTMDHDKNWFYYVMNAGMSVGAVLLATGL